MNLTKFKNQRIILSVLIFWIGIQKATQAQDTSTYYQITHPETGAVSFLLGTYHNYPEGWYEVPDQIKADLSKVTALVTELGDHSSFKKPEKMAKAYRYKSGKTIFDYMKKWQREEFQTYLDEKIGGSESQKQSTLNRRPYFMINQLFGLRFSDSVMNMENELVALAREKNLPLLDLEPDEKRIYQIAKQYGRKTPVQNIELTIEFTLTATAKMFGHYLEGDVEGMKKMGRGASQLAIERNRYWLPQLDSMLKKPHFIAVGTGHLMGEEGIHNLLRKKGFEVVSIPMQLPIPEDLELLLSQLEME